MQDLSRLPARREFSSATPMLPIIRHLNSRNMRKSARHFAERSLLSAAGPDLCAQPQNLNIPEMLVPMHGHRRRLRCLCLQWRVFCHFNSPFSVFHLFNNLGFYCYRKTVLTPLFHNFSHETHICCYSNAIFKVIQKPFNVIFLSIGSSLLAKNVHFCKCKHFLINNNYTL